MAGIRSLYACGSPLGALVALPLWYAVEGRQAWVTSVAQETMGIGQPNTWLYVVGPKTLPLNWSKPPPPTAYATAPAHMQDLLWE
jgi:hypothetical protein